MSQDKPSHGILSCGAYLPRWRMARSAITEAVGWTRGRAKAAPGARSFGNWDEDSLTMAVEACRALDLDDVPAGLDLASTSLPFADRSNSGVLREALGLPAELTLTDRTGSRKAATTTLIDALEGRESRLVCASECVDTRPGSESEGETGHGAAAVIVGEGDPLASLLASARMHQDFVDQYRMADQRFDYRLEARWLRDAGTRRQLSALMAQVLDAAGVAAEEVDQLLMPATTPVLRAVLKDNALSSASVSETLAMAAGVCGSAQPLLLLNQALAGASPGQLLLLVGVGQGFDVALLRVEEAIEARRPLAVGGDARAEDNYTRFLGLRRVLEMDGGLRAERDNRTSQSAAFRGHEEINGFVGGRCSACGQLQFPRSDICVECHESGTQESQSLSGLTGEVNSFTEDWLAWTPRPPLMFGNVHFPGGANVMLEFTDFEPGELQTGDPVRMAFRIKDFDDRRGFRRYFWKPAPVGGGQGNG